MKMLVSLLFSGFMLTRMVSGNASPQCLQETTQLEQDSFLDMIQDDLYNQYKSDFDSFCDFQGLTTPDCGLKFDGDNATYVAACQDKGGQVLTRPVVLKCGYSVAQVDWDLGEVPTCIGISCNASAVGPEELMDTRVSEFFSNLSFTGCNADFGSSAGYYGVGFSALLAGLMLALN